MDDPDVVAAIAAGEPDGLAAALDKYAAPLYEHCYSMAPEIAADAVQDAFIIAWSRLGGLRDPGKLHSWLQAVAGNECFRRTLANSVTDVHADVPPEATSSPKTTLPPGLPGQILSACADDTPAGRANRTSVTHRAGPFGSDGFPKANALRGTRRRVRRHRQAGAAVAAAAVLAAAAIMIVAISPASSSHHYQASAARPGSRQAGGSTVPGADHPTTRARPVPSSSMANSPGTAAPSVTAAAAKPAGVPAGAPLVVPTATVLQGASPSPSLSLPPSPSPTSTRPRHRHRHRHGG
jgi:hypothetical protein